VSAFSGFWETLRNRFLFQIYYRITWLKPSANEIAGKVSLHSASLKRRVNESLNLPTAFDLSSMSTIRADKKIKHTKKLTSQNVSGITSPVTKITVFETSEGIGERSGDTLGESNGRAVCSCY